MEVDATNSWESILEKAILSDEEHVSKSIRCLIHYMETVPMSLRSRIFTDTFLQQCAFKMADLSQLKEYFKFYFVKFFY